MEFSDLDVVVWTESEEREAWWRGVVGVRTMPSPHGDQDPRTAGEGSVFRTHVKKDSPRSVITDP
ncbi:hypothetical protein [Rhodococcus sp. OK302]|uniref:hypothetical protein n=1 Tax=Rhodococcus sp. OK302 TaxID=1882769 RepID=UPI0011403E9E|nr:hypothetical protein [Rhodococcus sp. OK302]